MLHLSLLFSLYVESLLCTHKFSPSYTELQYLVWIQQAWTAESEVLYTILPNQVLTLLQNLEATNHCQDRVSFQRICHIWRFIFIHYQQHQAQFEHLWLQLLPLTKAPKLCPRSADSQNTDNSGQHGHPSYARTRGILTTFCAVICRGKHDQSISQDSIWLEPRVS